MTDIIEPIPAPEQPVPVPDPRLEQIKLILKGVLATSVVFQWVFIIGGCILGYKIFDANVEAQIFTQRSGHQVTAWECFFLNFHYQFPEEVDEIGTDQTEESFGYTSGTVTDQDTEATSTDTGG